MTGEIVGPILVLACFLIFLWSVVLCFIKDSCE